MILSLIHWLGLALSMWVVGKVVTQVLDKSNKNEYDFFQNIWIGLVVLVAYLQAMSLFIGIGSELVWIVWAAVTFFSVIALFLNRKKRIEWRELIIPKKLLFASLAIVILSLYSATETVVWYDTYLYHFNMVAWNRDYGVVPGLANLHDRLGFNSSFHVLAAFSERFVADGGSVFITNGLIMTLLALNYLYIACSRKEKITTRVIAILLLPYIAMRINEGELASLSTDLAMTAMSLVFAMGLIRFPHNYFFLISCAALLSSIKLSGAVALLIVAIALIWKRDISFTKLVIVGLLGASVMLGYMWRNVIISGYPLYPSTQLAFPVEWRVPTEEVKLTADTIKGWARMPGRDYLKSLNGGWFFWIGPWWNRVKNSLEIRVFFLTTVLAIIYHKEIKNKWLLGYGLGSIFLLLVMAPDLRFGTVFFVLAGVSIIASIMRAWIKDEQIILKSAVVLCLIFVAWTVLPKIEIDDVRPPIMSYEYQISKIELVPKTLNDKTVVLSPLYGDQCGNSPIPCTPYNTRAVMRDVNDISKGFRYE